MSAPDFRPLVIFAWIGMAVTAPLWLPLYVAARAQDWFEKRRHKRWMAAHQPGRAE